MTYKKLGGNSLSSASVDALGDVDTTGANSGEVLKFNGSEWVPASDNASGNVERFTLSASNISNKYVDLIAAPLTPSLARLAVAGAPTLDNGIDYAIITNGVDLRRLSWSGYGLDGILEENDKLTIEYD